MHIKRNERAASDQSHTWASPAVEASEREISRMRSRESISENMKIPNSISKKSGTVAAAKL